MNHSIGHRTHDNDTKWQGGNILLKFDIAVECHKYIATIAGPPHQLTIQHTTPAQANNCTDIVALQFSGEVDWNVSSRRMRISHKRIAGKFQSGDRLLTLDGRKLMQKLVQCFTTLNVVKQGPDRNTGSHEYRRSAKDIGMTMCNVIEMDHVISPGNHEYRLGLP